MAKASWVNTTPSSGSGNAAVTVSSSSEHTGRVARTSVITFKAANVADVARQVIQAGKAEYVDIADQAAADQAGKTVTISGVTNSRKLTFSLGIGDLNITLPATYIANSITTTNGAEIYGDPGATKEFPFSISIVVPRNTSTSAISRQIIVTDEAGHQDVCTLTSAAGDAYLTVQLGDIELDSKGTPVTITVESNTAWTVE